MLGRGRPPVPTHLKLLRGNPGKRPINMNEPQPDVVADVPDAPPFLAQYACDEWYRIAEELQRLHLLTAFDLNPLAAYCQAYARWRMAEEALAEMAARDPLLDFADVIEVVAEAGSVAWPQCGTQV